MEQSPNWKITSSLASQAIPRYTYVIAKPREFHFFYCIQKLQLKNDLNKIADAY